MRDVAAILLAAGRSKRMGAFKPLLPFGNQTVIEASIEYLRKAGIEIIVVVLGHRAEEVRKQLAHLPVTFAFNPDPESEMSASIAAALPLFPATVKATLIALADHPAVPAGVVGRVIEAWQDRAPLVIPTWQDRGGHPVLVDLRFRKELENLDPSHGLKALFTTHHNDVKRVPVDSPFVARDMDTWDDYRVLYKEIFGEPPPERPSDQSNERPGGLI